MPPANDDFANATVISGLSGNVTFSNVGATFESGEPVIATDGGSVWFAWTAPASGAAYVRTGLTPLPTWDSFVAVYTGTTVASLTLVVEDDDGDLQPGSTDTIGTSKASWTATSGTTYYIQVTAFDDVSGPVERSDLRLDWHLADPLAPTITGGDSFGVSGSGDTVRIDGTNLDTVTTVTIAGVSASFTYDSTLARINAVMPTVTAPGDIVVTNPHGSASTVFVIYFPGPWVTRAPITLGPITVDIAHYGFWRYAGNASTPPGETFADACEGTGTGFFAAESIWSGVRAYVAEGASTAHSWEVEQVQFAIDRQSINDWLGNPTNNHASLAVTSPGGDVADIEYETTPGSGIGHDEVGHLINAEILGGSAAVPLTANSREPVTTTGPITFDSFFGEAGQLDAIYHALPTTAFIAGASLAGAPLKGSVSTIDGSWDQAITLTVTFAATDWTTSGLIPLVVTVDAQITHAAPTAGTNTAPTGAGDQSWGTTISRPTAPYDLTFTVQPARYRFLHELPVGVIEAWALVDGSQGNEFWG